MTEQAIKVGTKLRNKQTGTYGEVVRIEQAPDVGHIVYLKYGQGPTERESAVGWEMWAIREAWKVVP